MPLNFFRVEKVADRASFLTRRTKTAMDQSQKYSDSRSKPGTQGHMALSQVTSVSSWILHLPVFFSSGGHFGHLLLNHYYFIPSHSPLHFKSNFKQKWIYQPFQHIINYINLKFYFLHRIFLTPYIQIGSKSMILITDLHTCSMAC